MVNRLLARAEDWAKRLVRYYSHFGFVPMYEVGDRGLADLPDLLVWGGVGTRMDADVERMLRRWSRSLRRAPSVLPLSLDEGSNVGT